MARVRKTVVKPEAGAASEEPRPVEMPPPEQVEPGSNLFAGQIEKPREPEPEPPAVTDEEFLDYIKAEVEPTAKRLGYKLTLVRDEPAVKAFAGPTARYQRDTGEMRIFTHPDEVPEDFISADDFFRKV